VTKESYYVITLDVGGTQIKAVAVGDKGKIIRDTVSIHPSKASGSKEEILDNLTGIILSTTRLARDQGKCLGVCFAFPGPFDYENGICYIKGVGKYEALYGVNVRSEVRRSIEENVLSDFVEDFETFFENDARLFALGWYVSNRELQLKRVMFVSLGTGVGSAFIDNGRLVISGRDVPPGGYVYNLEFEGKTIEDVFSARGILSLAKELGLEGMKSVKELSEKARLGDQTARRLFLHYGRMLGIVLRPIIKNFRADALVIGGQIAKSYDLFLETLRKTLSSDSTDILIAEDSYIFTFVGAYNFFMEKRLSGADYHDHF